MRGWQSDTSNVLLTAAMTTGIVSVLLTLQQLFVKWSQQISRYSAIQ